MTVTVTDLLVEFGNVQRAAQQIGIPELRLHQGSRVQGVAYGISGGGFVGEMAIGRTRAEAVVGLRAMALAFELTAKAIKAGNDPVNRTVFAD